MATVFFSNFKLPAVFAFLLCFSILAFVADAEICPPANFIEPCTCHGNGTGPIGLRCYEITNMTQETIKNILLIMRGFNGLSSTDLLHLDFVYLAFLQDMTELDLAPFVYAKINRFEVYTCIHLAHIFGPGWPYEETIQAETLRIYYNYDLSDEGIGDSLRHFNGTTLKHLSLHQNNLTGSKQGFEFLPGFSSFKNLNELDLARNYLNVLHGGSFLANNRLETLDLLYYWYERDPVVIMDNAFLFNPIDDPTDPILNTTLVIDLSYTFTNDTSLNMRGNGLHLTQRPVHLNLENNLLTTIRQEDFKQFFNSNKLNQVDFSTNRIVCDENTRWLKEEEDVYSGQVLNALCTNDWPNNVFNSTVYL